MKIAFGLVLSLVLLAPASAGTLTFAVTHPVQLLGNTPFVFPGFDPNQGTLETVELSAHAAATPMGGLQGLNGDLFVMSSFVVQGRLTMTHFLFPSFQVPTPGLSVAQTDDASTLEPVPPLGRRPLFFDLPAAESTVLLTSFSDRDFFTSEGEVTLRGGSGFFVMPIGSRAQDSGVSGFPDRPVPLTATLTYHFTPVPEPSTLALLAVGALGLLGWGRLRRPM